MTSDPAMNERPTRVRWLMVALLFTIYVLMFVDRVNISIAAKYIMPEFGLGDVQMGWIFSAFVLGYAIMQIPGGWLGDRAGPRRTMTWAIVWWSSLTAATAIAGDLFLASLAGVVGSFAIVRALIGLGEAAALPNGNRMIASWVAPRERGLALGLTLSGVSIGAAVTPPLIAWIMVTWGWREAFYIAGASGVVVAIIWYCLVTDHPAAHRWVNAAELRHITQAHTDTPTQRIGRPVPWRSLFARVDLLCLTLAYFAFGYIVYIYYSWFYLYLVNVRGFSVLGGAFYSTAPFLASAMAAPAGGWLTDRLSDRFGKRTGRCGLGIAGLLLTAVFILLGAGADNPYLAVLLLSLGAGVLFASSAAYWATTIDLTERYAGTASGFMNTGANLGGALSPTLTPWLAERLGWENALYIAAAIAFASAFFWLGVHPERAIDLADASSGSRRSSTSSPSAADVMSGS